MWCEYCGQYPATPVVIPEPTDRGTYREETRTLCIDCKVQYMHIPYGFFLED